PLGELVIGLPVLAVALVVFGIDHRAMLADADAQPVALDRPLDHRGTAHQDRRREILVHGDLYGAQYALTLAFRVDDAAAFRRHRACRGKYRLHERAAVVHE